MATKLINGERVEMTPGEEAAFEASRQPGPVTIAQVNVHAETLLRAVVANWPEQEQKTWPTQEAEALAFQANNQADTPTLDAIKLDSETKAQLVTRVLENAAGLRALSNPIIAARRALVAMDPIPSDYQDEKWWPS